MVTLHSPGIYSYIREHSLAARKQNRGQITLDDLRQIKATDSKQFIADQEAAGCSYVSDGQFLWKDLARPFSLQVPEESLEMVRRADTNTFMRRAKINAVEDVRPVDLSQFLLHRVPNQQVSLVGPYSYANLADISETVPRADLLVAYAKAAAESLKSLVAGGLAHVLLTEVQLWENKPDPELWALEKEALQILKDALPEVKITFGSFYNSPKDFWTDLLEFPVNAIAIDLRSRDYLSIISDAQELINHHAFLFETDTDKTITLGCVNGRNGGLTPDKGLETPEWIASVVNAAQQKNDNLQFGISFSSDETIIPRNIADAKLKNLGEAKKLLEVQA